MNRSGGCVRRRFSWRGARPERRDNRHNRVRLPEFAGPAGARGTGPRSPRGAGLPGPKPLFVDTARLEAVAGIENHGREQRAGTTRETGDEREKLPFSALQLAVMLALLFLPGRVRRRLHSGGRSWFRRTALVVLLFPGALVAVTPSAGRSRSGSVQPVRHPVCGRPPRSADRVDCGAHRAQVVARRRPHPLRVPKGGYRHRGSGRPRVSPGARGTYRTDGDRERRRYALVRR